ncbi:hypothetical protein HPB52_001198 [Rhipicephalus sanguineus]|uniref:Uncharacterized protein n=1 Tax=Rhipicephalus sanguineus TaxID=34632 RepID=A0A9D4PTJ6_RHISA|nr:hypothetical protein HPB52_001198 [Rhipicephalus sanguineus]
MLPSWVQPGEDRSELHLCALRGIWSDIQPGLLEPGKLEVRDRLGRTPLFLCVMLGDSQGAQMLLRAGARPDHGDHAGQTPLHLAARKGHRSLVRLLLSAGAPWTRGDVHGCTPLHCVATVSLPQARSVLAMLLECMDASQVDLQDKLKGASFADYVEVDTCASVCGALTDEDIIARAAGVQPVAEEPEGEEDEDDEVPVRPSTSEVMGALNVTRSFEEGEEDSLRRVRVLEQRAAAVAFREKKQMVITYFFDQ